MLPMPVVHHFDWVLAARKAELLPGHECSTDKFMGEAMDNRLNNAAEQRFHTDSQYARATTRVGRHFRAGL
jgi:hypothetical protein